MSILSLTIEGFVVTMFDGRTRVHTQVVNELNEHFKEMVFKTIIQRNIRLRKPLRTGSRSFCTT